MDTDANRRRLYTLVAVAAALAVALTANSLTRTPAHAGASSNTIALAISNGDGLRLRLRGTYPPSRNAGATLICTRIYTTPFARLGVACQRSAAAAPTQQQFWIY